MIRKSKSLLAVLSTIVLLSMWSNVLAATLCPHRRGNSDCCWMREVNNLSPAGLRGIHMAHLQMSDTDMSDMQMDGIDMPDMQMSGMAMSHSEISDRRVDEVTGESGPYLQATGDTVTQPAQSCSHCILHSQSGATLPLRVVAPGSYTHEVIATEGSSEIVDPVLSLVSRLDLHDHGPPGISGPRYVLINVFRI